MLGWIGGRSSGGWWRRCAVAATTAPVVLTTTGAAQASSRDGGAPVYMARGAGVAGQYIVVLKGALPIKPTERSEQAATKEDEKVASSVKAKPLFVYNADIKGFAADLTDAQLRDLKHSAHVEYVEQDARVQLFSTQTSPPWDLDRIDQRFLPLNSTYDYSSTGAGGPRVHTRYGITVKPPRFRLPGVHSYDALGGNGSDCNGHGTHVAGIVGGRKYGVAKLATLVGVRGLGCSGSGTNANVIAGLNWVTEHHVADKSVANMSLGGGASSAVDGAVSHLIESGVFVVAAAGNDSADACRYSPARVPAAFTTAASDVNDNRASFSNYGPCVDAYAPGVQITSDWLAGGTKTIGGTSMAAPAVAGTAALYLSDHPSTPVATGTWIAEHATTGVINNNRSGTADRLLYTAAL